MTDPFIYVLMVNECFFRRYNFERFSVGLPRVARLSSLRDPLEEGYFSKLDSLVSSRSWPPRYSGAILKDVHRDPVNFDLSDIERWRDRIMDAIAQGAYIDVRSRSL